MNQKRINRFALWIISVYLITPFFWTHTVQAKSENIIPNIVGENASKIFKNLDFEKSSPFNSNKPQIWETLTDLRIKEADLNAIYEWDDKTSYSGKRSVKIKRFTEDKMAGWVQKVACGEPGKRYQVSAWVKTEGIAAIHSSKSGAKLLIIAHVKGASPVVFDTPLAKGTQNWQQLQLVFIVPERCSEIMLVLGLQLTKGSAWWDNVSIKELTPIKRSGLREIIKSELDQYGGWKKIKGKATGFFHTEKIGNRWWIITPEGNSFIVIGLQHMFRNNKVSEKIEEIKNMPTNKDNMRERFQILTQIIPHIANKYGADIGKLLPYSEAMEIKDLVNSNDVNAVQKIDDVFKEIEEVINKSASQMQWIQSSTQKLKKWGFNTLSHNRLFKQFAYDAKASHSLWGFPFVTPELRVPAIDIDPGHPFAKVISFPDVFDKKFKEIVEKDFKKTAVRLKDDPWLLGYFLGNELPWSGHQLTAANSPNKSPILDMFFALPRNRAGKRELAEFLKKRYSNNTDIFNKVWGTQIKDFNELLTMTKLGKGKKREQCQKDRSDFLRLVAEKYFKSYYETIKKYDSNHMILGARFIGHRVPKEVLETMGKYVDIATFQPYDPIAPIEWLEESYKFHKKPILVTEFSFKAKDSGLPNTLGAGLTFESQKDRALWYERYISRLLSSPVMVGQIWYKYADDPLRAQGENSNYGLVTYNEKPYVDLVKKVTEVNHNIYHMAVMATFEN